MLESGVLSGLDLAKCAVWGTISAPPQKLMDPAKDLRMLQSFKPYRKP